MQPGDEMVVNLRFFDDQGQLLYSTFESDWPQLNDSAAQSSDFGAPRKLSPARLTVPNATEPLQLSKKAFFLTGAAFIGQPIGSTFSGEVNGPLDGYSEKKALARARGPFNDTMIVSKIVLESMGFAPTNGALVNLDDVLQAEIINSTTDTVTVRLRLSVGDELAVKGTALKATVQSGLDGNTFFLSLYGEPGSRFFLQKDCRFVGYVLSPGGYYIDSVNETAVNLHKSSVPYPQLVGREVSVFIEVIDIIRASGPGGEEE